MRFYASLIVTVLLTVLDSAVCDLDPCENGYHIAKEYTDCWRDSKFLNKTNKLSVPQLVYTAKDVEEYATHMCSVVKPAALECLTRQVSRCSNIKKILEMADTSGGTCYHNQLDDYFKHAIIDHLPPVRSDSACFNISDTSRCYDNAASSIRSHSVPISKFHFEADKFFAKIWECQVQLYKSNEKICPNWQIPMLLSLQDMAMPTLFGMKLTEEHISMLEPLRFYGSQKPRDILDLSVCHQLKNEAPTTRRRPIFTTPRPPSGDEIPSKKVFILLRVLTQKPDASDGDVVIQVNVGGNSVEDVKANVKQNKNKGNRGYKPEKKVTFAPPPPDNNKFIRF